MPILDDRVCVITGGAGSIGAAPARLFLAEGARVMLVDLRQADLDRATQGLDRSRVASFAADVSRADEIAQSVLYLASDRSSFTTGAMPMVDGRMSV